MVIYLSFEELKNKFITNNKLKFKLYSLEYVVETVDNRVEIYATYYQTRKNSYNSFDELMNNYTVYNEPLINQINRIIVLE